MNTLKSLGNKSEYKFNNPDPNILETFPNPQKNIYLINLNCLEFTTLCPITNQPDYAKISIIYVPNKLCVESKSLKLYLNSFRNHGNFHEDVINLMANSLFKLLKAKYLQIFGDFNPRGGIAIKPFVSLKGRITKKELEEINHLLNHNPNKTISRKE